MTGTVTGGEGLELAANGASLRTTSSQDTFGARVPAEAASAYGEGRLVLRFADRAPTDLRLLTLRIEAVS